MFHSLSNRIFRNLFVNGKQPVFTICTNQWHVRESLQLASKMDLNKWDTNFVWNVSTHDAQTASSLSFSSGLVREWTRARAVKPQDARNEGVSRVLLDGLQKKERLLVVYMVLIRWEIQKLWLENQIVRAILFVELQKNMVCDLRGWNFPLLFLVCSADLDMHRLRAVSYFSLQSCCTRNLSTRAAKPRAARNEDPLL